MCLTVLHNLLVPNMFGQMDRTGTLWTAELREDDSSTRLKRVDITDVPVGSELIKMDGAREPNYFLDDAGQRRRCDYLLITKAKNGKMILLFMELKSGGSTPKKVERQFLASECLLDYIESMLGRFHSCPKVFERYEKRFVLFQTKNLNKRATKHGAPNGAGKSPENMKRIPNPRNPTLEYLIR